MTGGGTGSGSSGGTGSGGGSGSGIGMGGSGDGGGSGVSSRIRPLCPYLRDHKPATGQDRWGGRPVLPTERIARERGVKRMRAPGVGLEPTTYRLTAERSTD